MLVTYHLLSNRGNRKNNEDKIGSYEKNGDFCFALADGLGGHQKGEVASKIAIETTLNDFKEEGFSEFFIREAFELSQENIIKKQQELRMPNDIMSTLVILCVSEKRINWGHVGDSRLYMFKKNKIIAHTLDHSVPQMLVNIGEISEEDIRNHPDRNHILKAMGMDWERPQYEIGEQIDFENGLSFLIATDGFWELITESEMVKCLKKSSDVHSWVKLMTDIVEKKGIKQDMDNYSAIGVWIR